MSKKSDFSITLTNQESLTYQNGLNELIGYDKASIIFKSKVAKLLRTIEPFTKEYQKSATELEKTYGKTKKENGEEVVVRKPLTPSELKRYNIIPEKDENGEDKPVYNPNIGAIEFKSKKDETAFNNELNALLNESINIVLPCVLKTSNFVDRDGNELPVSTSMYYLLDKVIEIDE